MILIDPENLAGDIARHSFSIVLGCGLLLGFLLGEANAKISSSSSNSSNRSFFLFTGAGASGEVVNGRCFFDATSFSFSFSMAITSSNRSKEPSSTTDAGVGSTGLGFFAFGLTVITGFGVAAPLDGAGGVARGVKLPPIFNFRLGVGVWTAVGATGAAGVLGSHSIIALWQEMGTSRGGPPRSFLGESLLRSVPLVEITFGSFAMNVLTFGGSS